MMMRRSTCGVHNILSKLYVFHIVFVLEKKKKKQLYTINVVSDNNIYHRYVNHMGFSRLVEFNMLLILEHTN